MSPTDADRAFPADPAAPAEPAGDTPADRVATAATSVAGVASLGGGAVGEVATYLPGRRVAGVRLRDDVTEVHVVLTYGEPVRAVARRVQQAVAAVTGGSVDVVVTDVVPAGAPGPSPAGARGTSPESVSSGPVLDRSSGGGPGAGVVP